MTDYIKKVMKFLGVGSEPRPEGIDISKYQAPQDLTRPHGINFAVMLAAVDFLMIRAGFAGSAGGAWTDPRVHEYMREVKILLLRNPKPFTFYWYFRDDVSIMEQVNRFSSIVNEYKDVITLPLVVDAEAFVKTNLVSTQKIKDFQFEVERQTGLLVDTLYGRAGQLNSETTPGLPEVLPYLHVARYDTRLDPQKDEPWIEGGVQEYVEPRDYDTWAFWQYTESGDESKYGVTVGAKGIDESVFNGTLDELLSFANLDDPIPPPPPPPPPPSPDCCDEVREEIQLLYNEIGFLKGEIGTLNQRAELTENDIVLLNQDMIVIEGLLAKVRAIFC